VTATAAGDHEPAARDEARVRRLLLWYPRAWRIRYGEEFAELLAAELTDAGPSWRRAANVAATGPRARLAGAGLAGHPLDPAEAAGASLATAAACAAAVVLAGAAMWSQLAIGLQWSVPGGRGITQAMALMSGSLLLLAVLAPLAAAPVVWAVLVAAARGRGRPFLRPSALIGSGIGVLVIGGRHFQNGWPGTGGHLLAHQTLVPAGIAAFGWAATMWITSYWGHPAALAAFPAAQLAWMVLSPAAAGCLITGAARVIRRVELSPRAFRYEIWIARLSLAAVAALLSGALSWLLAQGGGAGPLFRAGAVDRAGLTVLAMAAVAGAAATRQARAAARAAAAATRR
jgi:hypothetical protein